MKVLIADKFQASGVAALQDMGCTVVNEPDAQDDALVAAIESHDPDVLIVRSTKVPAGVFAAARKLSLVVRAGAGYDNIDVAAASDAAISVANCPGKNAVAVAELAWGLILACDRDIPAQHAELVEGKWNKKAFAKRPLGLLGRTLGVVGVGAIGGEIIARAHGFGMPVVAWSRSLTDAKAKALGAQRVGSPLDVAERADVVCLCVAATDDTMGMVNAEFLAKMKDGATLINTARGSVVDYAALEEAVRSRGIRAGLDVWPNQPTPADTTSDLPIAKLPGVVGTHHNGASTEQAQEAIAAEAVRIVGEYMDSGNIPHVVNRRAPGKPARLVTVRHYNKPGVLAHVVDCLRDAKINIEEMENVIYQGAKAAAAKIRVDNAPSAELLDRIRAGENVLSVDLSETE
jgi:D-3-phosphoglycerate dehydrogenase